MLLAENVVVVVQGEDSSKPKAWGPAHSACSRRVI